MVVASGHRHRTHQARSFPTEWPPRAHALDLEERSHTTGWREYLAAGSQVRRLLRRIQLRTAA